MKEFEIKIEDKLLLVLSKIAHHKGITLNSQIINVLWDAVGVEPAKFDKDYQEAINHCKDIVVKDSENNHEFSINKGYRYYLCHENIEENRRD
jgi:hypothetical protein